MKRRTIILGACGLLLAAARSLEAQSVTTWEGGISPANWDVAGNWSNGIPVSTSIVEINGSTVNVPSNLGSGNPAVASDISANGSAKLNILNSGVLNVSDATVVTNGAIVTVNAGGTLNSTNVHLETATDVLINRGTLVTSQLLIDGGTSKVYLMGNTSGVAQVVVGSGGMLYVGVDTNGVSTASTQSIGDIASMGNVVIGTGSTLNLNVSDTVYSLPPSAYPVPTGSVSLTVIQFGSEIDGVISGAGNLAVTGVSGGGQLVLTGANTYMGTTSLANQAWLGLSDAGSIASSQSVTLGTGSTLDISEAGGPAMVQNLGGDATSFIALGGNTLVVAESSTTAFHGVISGTGGIEVSGNGVFELTGTNVYTGPTTIDLGATLALGGTNAIADSSTVTINGTLDISSSTGVQTVNDISGTGNIVLGSQTLTANVVDGSTFAGSINGTGTFGVSGAGTLVLTGSDNAGATKLFGTATLQVGDGGTTGTLGSGAITLNAGTTLAIDHAAGSTYTLGNALSGGGALSQMGGGTTVVNGSDAAFTGAATVSNGILEVDNTFGTSAVTVAVTGGALRGTGTIAGTVAVTEGILAAGTAATTGHLTLGTLSLTSGSTVVLRETAGGSDSITVGGTTALAGTLEYALNGSTGTVGADVFTGITGATTGGYDNVVVAGNGTLNLTQSSAGSGFAGNFQIGQGVAINALNSNALVSAASVLLNGTLDVSAQGAAINNLSGAGTVNLGSQTLNVQETGNAQTAPTLFSGTINGSGNLDVTGVGRLVLSGNNTFTGVTHVFDTAVLQLGNGGSTGTAGTGDLTIESGGTVAIDHSAGSTYNVVNNIGGHGTIDQLGGNTILTGGNDLYFAGTINVSGGVFEVDNTIYGGALAASAVNVTGGVLRGNAVLNAPVNIGDGGTLGAGTASTPGTLTINGALTMTSNSAAAFRVIGPAAKDEVAVNGNATLGGNATFYVSGMTIRDGDSVNVMQVSGSVTGNYASVTNALHNALYYHSVVAGSDVNFVASQGSFAPFTSTGNQASIAANLDSVVHDARSTSVIDYLNTLQGSQLGAAMNQIAPTPMIALPNILQASSDNVSQALSQRMTALRNGSTGLAVENLDLGPNIAFDPRSLLVDNDDTAPLGYTPPAADFLAPTAQNRWGTFVSGLGTAGSVDDSSLPGYNYYSGGVQGGIDYRVLPSLMIGAAVGYQHGQADFNDSSSKIDTDTGNLHLYSTWKDQTGDWIQGNVGGSYNWFDSKRESLDGTASAKPHGTEIDGMIEGGHDFTSISNWTVTPTIGILYDRVMFDSFTETGSLTPLSVNSHDADSFRSRAGITLSKGMQMGMTLVVDPYVQLGWQHEYLDQNSSVSARFASGAGGAFTTSGPGVGSDSATFGLGVTSMVSPAISVSLGYFGQANSDYLENDLQGTVRYRF
jgi:fibronectin-binding autotransporter adhesin